MYTLVYAEPFQKEPQTTFYNQKKIIIINNLERFVRLLHTLMMVRIPRSKMTGIPEHPCDIYQKVKTFSFSQIKLLHVVVTHSPLMIYLTKSDSYMLSHRYHPLFLLLIDGYLAEILILPISVCINVPFLDCSFDTFCGVCLQPSRLCHRKQNADDYPASICCKDRWCCIFGFLNDGHTCISC